MSLQMQMSVSAVTEADIQEKDFGNSLIQKPIYNRPVLQLQFVVENTTN